MAGQRSFNTVLSKYVINNSVARLAIDEHFTIDA